MNKKQKTKNKIPVKALKLLPWYATGWLSPEERSYLKKVIAEFPELQELLKNELEMIRLIKEDHSILDQTLLEPVETRLENVLKKLEAKPNTEHAQSFLKIGLQKLTTIFDLRDISKIQYAAIATVSTLSLIALLFTFISPLMKQDNIFYPAAHEETHKKYSNTVTVLLIGLSTGLDNPTLLKLLKESHAIISAVPGKDGMYRIRLPEKLNPKQTANLIEKLAIHKDLFWFTGEAY